MKTNNKAGRSIAIAIVVWLVVKFALNLIIGGFGFQDLALTVVECALLILGIKYTNYIVAGLLALFVLIYLPGNISKIFSFDFKYLIYLAEGIVDVGCAAVVCLSSAVKEHFTNDISDISGGN